MPRGASLSVRACIFGCAGPTLGADEKRFFAEAQPWGFILFARNCETEEQIRNLCADLREAVGRHTPILIDEEGGRVSRLRGLGGRIGPPAAVFSNSGLLSEEMYAAVRANYAAIGARLASLGIDVDCAPVLDLPASNADPIIGDRAFSTKPELAAKLGQACLDGLNAAGVSGIIKHIPGHGRADVDSHLTLPVVSASKNDLQTHDFLPFSALKNAPMAMTAHVIYEAYDPQNAATCSKIMIEEVIRGRIGFDGLLMSDDLDMKALSGTLAVRTRASIDAGCDVVLHCNGVLDNMREVADAAPLLTGKALSRAHAARAGIKPSSHDLKTLEAEADHWMARLGARKPGATA